MSIPHIGAAEGEETGEQRKRGNGGQDDQRTGQHAGICLGTGAAQGNSKAPMHSGEAHTERKAICVFCGSSLGQNPAFAEAARRLGEVIAARGDRLVYGGGMIGLMHEVASAARKGGAPVTGIIPDFLHRRVGTTDPALVSDVVVTSSMHERKARMSEIADAFVVLPGGIGTLEEMTEILTWAQLELHAKPIVIVNLFGYWDEFVACLDKMVQAKFAEAPLLKMLKVVSTVDDAMKIL